MKSLGFAGLRRGDALTVSADGVSASSDYVAPGPITGTLTLEVTRTSLNVAPASVFFKATPSGIGVEAGSGFYDPLFHEVEYIWTFEDVDKDDPPIRYEAPDRLPEFLNDRNLGLGREVQHTFRTHGNHKVTCMAINLTTGLRAYNETIVTVEDPNIVFSPSHTFVISPTGDFTDAPPHVPGNRIFTSEVTYAHFNIDPSDLANNHYRFVFQKGATFNYADGTIHGPLAQSFYASSYGSGDRPVITGAGGAVFFVSSTNDMNIVLSGLDLDGGYDVVNASGTAKNCITLSMSGNDAHALVDDCVLRGGGVNFATGLTGIGSTWAVTNTVIKDWLGAGGLASDHASCKTALVGVKLTQHVDAPVAPAANFNGGWGFRWGANALAYVDVIEAFSRTGWWQNTPGIHTTQPCLRLNTKMVEGGKTRLSRFMCEGGAPVVQVRSSDPGNSPDRQQNVVIDRGILLGAQDTTALIQSTAGGTTIRNVLGILPATTARSNTLVTQSLIDIGVEVENADNLAAPIRVSNSTFVSLADEHVVNQGNPVVAVSIDARFTNADDPHNILHKPNETTAFVPFEPLDDTTLHLPAPLYNGYHDYDTPLIAGTETSHTGARALYAPELTSEALNSPGSSMFDLFGEFRLNPNLGAVER